MTQAAEDCLQRDYFHFHRKVTMEFNSSSAPFGICSINGFGLVPIYSLEREMPFLRSVTASPKVSATCQATPGGAEEEGVASSATSID